MSRHEVTIEAETVEPVTLARFFRTIRVYRGPILLSLAAVLAAYLMIAVVVLLLSPTLTVTTLPFRLEFQGAEDGRYPNGVEFNAVEIVSKPILTRVWQANDLQRFMPLSVFTTSVYVLEANPAMERLTRNYQARLADPKLSPIDRDRLFREFEGKKESISKNEYSLNFSAARHTHRLPNVLAKKVLTDVLREWSAFATREQRVLQYGIAVLSPNLVPPTEAGGSSMNYIVRLQVLRSKIYRVIANINVLEVLPGGKLVRTDGDGLTLNDLRTQLDDLVRFRLEPLVPTIRSSGLMPNAAEAIRFLEVQLAYDERQLAYADERAQVIRQAILTYSNANSAGSPPELSESAAEQPLRSKRPAGGDMVTPQLSDSFLDRLMSITAATTDVTYRQKLIDHYSSLAEQLPGLQTAVTYDREVIAQLRSAPVGSSPMTADDVEQQINTMQREVHAALEKLNELYVSLSRNLAPETHMYSATSVPTTRTERRMEPGRLVAFGILVLLLAFPVILGGVFIHNRVRQEDEIDEHHAHAAVARA